jgi:hypothetical protein
MKYVDISDLPPCSLSPECLRLIDDLDTPASPRAPSRLSHIHDFQDARQLRQLRSHVPACPTCSALLADARRVRSQQRTMLHHFLLANEIRVPSTTESIFVALRREQAQEEAVKSGRSKLKLVLTPPVVRPDAGSDPVSAPTHTRPPFYRSLLQNFLTLATVAAVILAAFGLLNRFTDQSGARNSSVPQKPAQPKTALSDAGWDSMVISLTLLSASGLAKSFTVYSFNALDGQMEPLLSGEAGISLDAVSPDGQSLLYDDASQDGQQVVYETFSNVARSQMAYRLDKRLAGNAIWMDPEHVLVQDLGGSVFELNAASGVRQQSWSLQTGKLVFYHQPFLYFEGASSSTLGTLYRVNLAESQPTPQEVTQSSPDTRFWLSPDGTTVFYANHGFAGQEGIYAVGSDGTHERLLSQGTGIPIGYAADDDLLALQQVGANVEVIKFGSASSQQPQVVFANAAPQASALCPKTQQLASLELCDQNIALDPDGQGLLLHTYYADGSHGLVYDNLATGTSQKIQSLASNTGVQLSGWSKIAPGQTSVAEPVALCA